MSFIIEDMTATAAMPAIATHPQDIAILNLNMLMQLEGKYRKDLAKHLGRMPQAVSRMFIIGSEWTFNDMWKAAEFVGVSLDVLTDPTLTPAKALSIIGERHDDNDGKNGGLPVVNVDDFRLRGGAWKAPAMILAA